MRTELIIIDGRTKITLKPENNFEKDLVEKVVDRINSIDVDVKALSDYGYGVRNNHRIEIHLNENETK